MSLASESLASEQAPQIEVSAPPEVQAGIAAVGTTLRDAWPPVMIGLGVVLTLMWMGALVWLLWMLVESI